MAIPPEQHISARLAVGEGGRLRDATDDTGRSIGHRLADLGGRHPTWLQLLAMAAPLVFGRAELRVLDGGRRRISKCATSRVIMAFGDLCVVILRCGLFAKCRLTRRPYGGSVVSHSADASRGATTYTP